jgi:uncharacterized membrane protein
MPDAELANSTASAKDTQMEHQFPATASQKDGRFSIRSISLLRKRKTFTSATMIASAMGALSLVSLAGASPAQADYRICNKTATPVEVAVGYVSPGGGFVTEGWWEIRGGGGCELLVLDTETSDRHHYFFYAEQVGGGSVWEGDSKLCTTQQAFKIAGHQSGNNWCGDRGYDRRFFVHVESASGNMTTNLTDGSSQIIDEG